MNTLSLVSCQVISSKSVPATTSLKIAEFTGKRHDHILVDIENLAPEFSGANFFKGEYKNRGKSYPMYVLDETFTSVLLMGFTGKEAVKWKIDYAKEFKRLRDQATVKRAKGDDFSVLNQVQKSIADHVRKTQEGKEGHIGYYVSLAKSTNEIAFGYHENGIRDNMTQEQSKKLNYAIQRTINLMLQGITNPTKVKETIKNKLVK